MYNVYRELCWLYGEGFQLSTVWTQRKKQKSNFWYETNMDTLDRRKLTKSEWFEMEPK